MASELAARHCVACHGGMPALAGEEIEALLARVESWRVEDNKRLKKTFRFADFVRAVDFVNTMTPIIEAEGHHPNLSVRWGAVGVTIWTHAIDALTDNDFILAAKFDRAYDDFSADKKGGSRQHSA